MTRLLLIGLVGAALLVCSSAPAQADLVVSDDFTYNDGLLAGNNGGAAGPGSSWTTEWATDWGDGWNVSGGQATASSDTGDERYFSTDFIGSPTAPLYFSARFKTSEGGSWDGPALDLCDSDWNAIEFGLVWDLDGSGVLQPFVWGWGSEYDDYATAGSCAAGQEVLIVGKLEFNVDGNKERFQIWVDPTNVETSAQYSTPVTVDIEWTTPEFVCLSNYGDISSSMDDVRVGDTWADVGPIPEPGTMTLLATGLIGLLCYAWRKRK